MTGSADMRHLSQPNRNSSSSLWYSYGKYWGTEEEETKLSTDIYSCGLNIKIIKFDYIHLR